MILSRKTSLFLLITHIAFIIYNLALLVVLKERFIIDLYHPPVQLSVPVWLSSQIFAVICFIAITAGLIIILKKTAQPSWIITSWIVYFLMRIMFDVVAVLVATNSTSAAWLASRAAGVISTTTFLFFVASGFFIQNRSIKPFYVWFGLLIFITSVFTPISHILYDDYGLTWALINPNVTKIFPFAVSLALFYSLYTQSRR